MKLVQTGILEVSQYSSIKLSTLYIFYFLGGFGRWTSDACVVVSKHGERPVKCKCNQPAHFGLLFVSASKYICKHEKLYANVQYTQYSRTPMVTANPGV